jgi:hypothetical protein
MTYMWSPVSGQNERDMTQRNAESGQQSLGRLVYDGLTIGELEGPEEYTFTRISVLQVDRDGFVYVMEGSPLNRSSFRKYTPTGKYVGRIGRVGAGPGEYRMPAGFALLRNGNIVVSDPSPANRLLLYSADGKPLATWNVPHDVLYNAAVPALTVSAEGVIALRHVMPAATGHPEREDVVIIRVGPNGRVLNTLPVPQLPDLTPGLITKRLESGRGVSVFGTITPYLPQARYFWSPLGYFVTGRTDRYEIDLHRPGKPMLRISRDIPPVPVSNDERAEQKAFHQRQLDSNPGEQSGPLPDVPSTKPFFRTIFFDADGRLFVRVSTPSEKFNPPERRRQNGTLVPQIRWREPLHFDVFETDGKYVGQFAVPYGVNVMFARGDVLWGVVRDEFDVECIKRYKIVWN